MKRSLSFLVLLAVALPGFAIQTDPVEVRRVGVIVSEGAAEEPALRRVAPALRRHLLDQLRKEGFDPFEVTTEIELLRQGEPPASDLFLEIVPRASGDAPRGDGIGVGGPHGGVAMGTVTSWITVTVRLYGGRTLALLDEFDIEGRDAAFVPTSLGVGGRYGIWLGIPIRRTPGSRAADEAAKEIVGKLLERR